MNDNKCQHCSMWIKQSYFGTCTHPNMDIPFMPFTGKIDRAQRHQNMMYTNKKHPPLTSWDYVCDDFQS